jgi:hypothetical protein
MFLKRDSARFHALLAGRSLVFPCSDGDAIFLPEVKSIDFERFLTVPYPKCVMLSV